MIITPAATVAGYRTVETFGLVRGNTIRARHIGKDIIALFKGAVGGEITEYTKMIAESREQAVQRMIDEAKSKGANAVTNVRFTTSYAMGGAAEILAFGEGVRIEPV